MLIVAYLANYNGMASWCWEAAHALHELGQSVLLVCAEDITLPGTPAVNILRFNPPRDVASSDRKTLLSRIHQQIQNLSNNHCDFLQPLHEHLQAQGIQPSAYFLNMASLQDPRIPVPQYVVGWGYPTSLYGYLAKVGKTAGWSFSKSTIRSGLEFFGWWRKDWCAYRESTAILSVSQRLTDELRSNSVKVHCVHPGTAVSSKLPEPHSAPCKLLIAAENLEDPRKRIHWMISALKASSNHNFTLTIVGQASEEFKTWACSDRFPATFTGRVPREQLQTLMAEHDVFLFGSKLDDWGYVLIEAMSQGLSVIAPDLSPFDEIVGETGVLYELTSSDAFCQAVNVLSQEQLLLAKRHQAWTRANQLFSRAAFGQSLLAALPESVIQAPVEVRS